MKLLIGGSKTFYLHFIEFAIELEKLGIEYKIVKEEYVHLYSRHFLNYFRKKNEYKKIIKGFNPDIVLTDNQILFAKTVLEIGKPLIIFLRGDYWEEMKLARQTIFKTFWQKRKINFAQKMGEKCFKGATLIVPLCEYLEKIVKEHYPEKQTKVIHLGIDSSKWFKQDGMKLKHPCVGLLQTANIWGKTKELMLLPKVLEALPEITFYWAGDGLYSSKILPLLQKFRNFVWLGNLEYPEKARQFLSEIDIYALMTGLDMTPLSLLEAQLLEKPSLATNVGGVPETMINHKTGFLIEKGNHNDWIEKLNELLTDDNKRKDLGIAGRKFVNENFCWKKTASDFLEIFKQNIKPL